MTTHIGISELENTLVAVVMRQMPFCVLHIEESVSQPVKMVLRELQRELCKLSQLGRPPPLAPVIVPWPRKEDVSEDMRAGFERLFERMNRHDPDTLRREGDGYAVRRVQGDWVFYQRAWADSREAM